MTEYETNVNDTNTHNARRPSRGRSVGLVGFLFGVTGRATLPGVVLRRLLEDLGLSPDASRALLSRMCRHGQLAGDRRGRSVDYRLAGEFAQGFERIRDQVMAQPTAWPGHFHAVLYQVPEHQRGFRDALRRTAVLAGYGLLQQGVLISPTDRSAQLADVLIARPSDTHVWTTTLGMELEGAAGAASLAWDLPDRARLYRCHTERLTRQADAHSRPGRPRGRPATSSGPEALRDYVDTLLPALTDTLREPRLAATLMPAHWPGPALRQAIARFNDTFASTTEPYLQTMLG